MKSIWLILLQLTNILFFLKDLPFFISSGKYLIDLMHRNKATMKRQSVEKDSYKGGLIFTVIYPPYPPNS